MSKLDIDLCHEEMGIDADILISSVFGPLTEITTSTSKFKILFSSENMEHYPDYLEAVYQGTTFDAVLSHELDDKNLNLYRVPSWFFYYRLYDQNSHFWRYFVNSTSLTVEGRFPRVSLVSRHAEVSNLLRGDIRIESAEALQQLNITIDSPGKFLNNMYSLEVMGLSKHEFLTNYVFNLCPENSFRRGYVTEKLPEAIVAGTLPIYWGDEKSEERIFNFKRVILINPEDMTEMSRVVNDLVNSPAKMRAYFQQHPFVDTAPVAIVQLFNKFILVARNIKSKFLGG
eukprot:CAMPEP_0118803486 /NCGR_PEP_ID=MMETSP1161-20130426/17523_1 /TAXON_ID=249345 /ORGANISM="Picochlorum oklahomensis, Strain CCMP2329" /LENGTH=285 /DNA_ID=CAMNT_0006732009 /DNA_START=381 /DNA_END=1241 /DNA_ORIENTATION=+